jgi:hypothetical protein
MFGGRNVSQGESIEKAIENLKEATELYLEEFPLPKVKQPFISVFEVKTHEKYPRPSGRGVIKALSKMGFALKRQKGSHLILVNFLFHLIPKDSKITFEFSSPK